MSCPAYNESVITNLITQVFDLYIQLCYFDKDDFVYPPFPASQHANALPRHSFPSETYELFSTLQLSRRAISLLERIPYLKDNVDTRKYPVYAYASSLISPIGINLEYSRSADGNEIEHPLLPSDVLLVTMAGGRDGNSLILDTEENPDDPKWQDFEYPDIKNHYRNWKAHSAPEFLEQWVDDIKTLNPIGWFESNSNNGELLFAHQGLDAEVDVTDEEIEAMPRWGDFYARFDECMSKRYKFLKRTLQQDYGWPNNFQMERWAVDHRDIWRQASDRYDPGLTDSPDR